MEAKFYSCHIQSSTILLPCGLMHLLFFFIVMTLYYIQRKYFITINCLIKCKVLPAVKFISAFLLRNKHLFNLEKRTRVKMRVSRTFLIQYYYRAFLYFKTQKETLTKTELNKKNVNNIVIYNIHFSRVKTNTLFCGTCNVKLRSKFIFFFRI